MKTPPTSPIPITTLPSSLSVTLCRRLPQLPPSKRIPSSTSRPLPNPTPPSPPYLCTCSPRFYSPPCGSCLYPGGYAVPASKRPLRVGTSTIPSFRFCSTPSGTTVRAVALARRSSIPFSLSRFSIPSVPTTSPWSLRGRPLCDALNPIPQAHPKKTNALFLLILLSYFAFFPVGRQLSYVRQRLQPKRPPFPRFKMYPSLCLSERVWRWGIAGMSCPICLDWAWAGGLKICLDAQALLDGPF